MNAIALSVFLVLAAGPPRAPTPAEEKLFAEGMEAMSRGDARAAEKAWRAGYDVARDPAFLVRIGEAQEKAGAPTEAADTYRRYLREAPDAADRADIEARIARLAPPAAAPPPAPEEVPGTLGGTRDEPGPGTPVPPAPPPARASQVDVGTDAPRGAGADEDGSTSAIGVAGWISVGLAATLLGAAGFYGASAGAKKDDVNKLLLFRDERTGRPLDYETVAGGYEQAVRDGRRYDRYAKTLALASGGTAGLALVLFVIDAAVGSPARTAARPRGGTMAIAADGQGGAAALAGWTF